eukprot:10214827-Alexandrium_andersonii.AAC.1
MPSFCPAGRSSGRACASSSRGLMRHSAAFKRAVLRSWGGGRYGDAASCPPLLGPRLVAPAGGH